MHDCSVYTRQVGFINNLSFNELFDMTHETVILQ